MDKFAKDCFKPEQTAADISHDCKASGPSNWIKTDEFHSGYAGPHYSSTTTHLGETALHFCKYKHALTEDPLHLLTLFHLVHIFSLECIDSGIELEGKRQKMNEKESVKLDISL